MGRKDWKCLIIVLGGGVSITCYQQEERGRQVPGRGKDFLQHNRGS